MQTKKITGATVWRWQLVIFTLTINSCNPCVLPDSEFRYITSNNVPDYYMNPYCPIGLGYGYCVPQVTFGLQYFLQYLAIFSTIFGTSFFAILSICNWISLSRSSIVSSQIWFVVLMATVRGEHLVILLMLRMVLLMILNQKCAKREFADRGNDFDCKSRLCQNPGTGTIQ